MTPGNEPDVVIIDESDLPPELVEERRKFASLCDDILATLDAGGFGLSHRVRHCVEQHKTGSPQTAVTGARRDNVSETEKIKALRAAEEAARPQPELAMPTPLPEPFTAGEDELAEPDEENAAEEGEDAPEPDIAF